ncbi:TPA: class I SAM-dependent methyltransferase [Legionella pneumophila]|uniref:class I SAM-dependent methyltransferase n=1 Tax=Legionella sp. PATHC039 TaxID=2992042 RepID=UPI0007782496|nr:MULTISPECIES: class I SAM-dependent methyltransferase [Legionella]BCL64416.1 methyltransferase [Legionella pneumophila serogroup 7]HAT8859012.1 methyltransferase domain-containing protein [Legionella pneumophila subsp. pneumophila]MCW8395617.1 class I SAM-dependent methyltransferase [Legionella sp. PATHC039]HAT8640937.1 methyltransferase domain-containing protein [Legionella pneumophila]HAT8889235.1 methyltransferase domain-containing protein [Legionella pneumophila subsp. pneumophila]
MDEVTIELPGSRIADDDIYLKEDRRDQPKDCFKDSLKFIDVKRWPTNSIWLDIGCATGDYIDFLKTRCNQFKFIGLDISEQMIKEASKRDPESRYISGDVRNLSLLPQNSIDIITIFGVIDCFDEVKTTFTSLMHWIKPGGLILALDIVNAYPVDTVTRYRRTHELNTPWEMGWNTYSRHTLERQIMQFQQVESFDFIPFEIATDLLPKTEDPMRTWTIKTEEKPRQLVNGAGQMVNLYFIPIKIKHCK